MMQILFKTKIDTNKIKGEIGKVLSLHAMKALK
jgi:hypothetical protein